MKTTDRWFEDIEVGDRRETVGRTITESDIVIHAGQTGDFFPHHMDAQWMATQPAGQRIAHGTLILSIAVGMTAGDINPQAMTYGYDRIRFVRPVFIGDTIHVSAEITQKTEHTRRPEEFGYVHELVTTTNQRGDTVMVLTHLYLVNRRVASA
ncbi:MaoC/PaaZ C-terminal domain-containing protein [Microbacterium sp. ET2]|uniref:MaoC/PaaZ C-terminal domain-containing protein n=1 Tax=Microbacterium albipurpureum TaxID=3050384 RepID=UPI00259CE785|nr:MaoC/PaaZ C-terminal domain-containing protein [Microbacterium sp. ET2 (Ac-2212)]WJL97017.1 MaoC/PaaZ C-terminal domain-containing protein [Microbacterium sp. ET2 (Ac-2212)]